MPAALTAYLSIQQLQPDLVISLGTAGGFKAQGGCIADVYVSTGFANHDRHIPIPVGSLQIFAECLNAGFRNLLGTVSSLCVSSK